MPARTPKKPDPREDRLDEIVLVRMTSTEKETFGGLAKKDTRSLSAWVRIACLEKARALGAKV